MCGRRAAKERAGATIVERRLRYDGGGGRVARVVRGEGAGGDAPDVFASRRKGNSIARPSSANIRRGLVGGI